MVFCPLTFLTRPERPHQRCGLEELRVQQVLTHNQSTINTMKYTMNNYNELMNDWKFMQLMIYFPTPF